MNSLRFSCLAVMVSMLVLSGCSSLSKPRTDPEIPVPSEVSDFKILYAENCAGCHGSEGRGGAAIALADPVYLAIANDASIRKVVANGVKGTSMPPFAQSAGGMLTDKQVEAIITGIRGWARPGILTGANPPGYAASSTSSFKILCCEVL